MDPRVQQFMAMIKARNPGENEFHQAVQEVAESLIPFIEENPKYKINCDCRKPKIGLIKKAEKDFNIDLKNSYFVGDSFRDILCGKNAGVITVGVKTGDALEDSKIDPDYFFDNIYYLFYCLSVKTK